ncbi:hypothetical protein RvY_05029 [Ramazzottius varieornatus]|uniref:Uncharacterized protein n=1 Tax=Ramazzottius varieornatus TaxID=947166 RepID=A0A1D1UTQ5_RAMVA|nr:hypothetical protein RvY_05029 [Ramazzottius varieornatus]
MPLRIVGRQSTLSGKYLFEILRNLKDFGIGRIVTRSLLERYPEPCYYLVRDVRPIMDPEGKFGLMDADVVFRGKNLGTQVVSTGFKADWKLVPKDEEASYTSQMKPDAKELPRKRVVPAAVPFPPVLRRLLTDEARKSGKDVTTEPILPLTLLRGPQNYPIQEGVEAPLGAASSPGNPINTILPQSMAGHLLISNVFGNKRKFKKKKFNA